MSAAISCGGVRSRAITATPRLDRGRGGGELGQRLQALGAGVVVRPDRVVAELGAASGERPRHLGVEPRGDAESAGHQAPPPGEEAAFSKRATHSMWGVWGNMSTGFTRRRV